MQPRFGRTNPRNRALWMRIMRNAGASGTTRAGPWQADAGK